MFALLVACLSQISRTRMALLYPSAWRAIIGGMPLEFRLARTAEHSQIEAMVIESFEPITWFKKLDARIGPLNNRDWRTRWQARMRRVFQTEIVLVGETDGALVAMSSGTLDRDDALAYIDLLAVDRRFR